jgi:hypothetical protein
MRRLAGDRDSLETFLCGGGSSCAEAAYGAVPICDVM